MGFQPPQHSLLTDFLVGNSWALGSLPLPWRGEGAVGPARRGCQVMCGASNENLLFLLGRIHFRMFTSSVLNFLISCCLLPTQPPHPTPVLPSLITSYLICYPIYEVQPFLTRLKRTKYSATSAHSGLGS